MSLPASISLAPDAADELDLLVFGFARQLHRRLAWKRRAAVVSIALCVCAVFTAGHYDHNVASFLRGEIDLFGETRYQPDHVTDPAALARIDFERVHRELLPDWFSYAGRARMYTSREEADAAFAALRQAVQPDQNLSEIVAELNLLLATRQYLRSTHRLHYLIWAWNDYLRRNNVPYWVQGRAHHGRYNAFFSVKTYDLLAQPAVKVGERGFNVGLVMRADNPLLSEPYLGAASRSARGAFVVVDRIQDLVVSEIWPLLGPPADAAMDPGQRAFAEAVQTEVRAQLPAWAVEILVRSAGHRWALSAAVDSLNARAACTGTQIAGVVPWDGVEATEHARLLELANLWQGRRCPAINPDEAEALVDASWALQREAGLPEALGALVAWLSRARPVPVDPRSCARWCAPRSRPTWPPSPGASRPPARSTRPAARSSASSTPTAWRCASSWMS